MPPGGGFGFELLADRAGRSYVRPVFITMTLDQMHAGQPLSFAAIPLYDGIALPGCEYQHGRLCSLARFVRIVGGSIQPSATGPIPLPVGLARPQDRVQRAVGPPPAQRQPRVAMAGGQRRADQPHIVEAAERQCRQRLRDRRFAGCRLPAQDAGQTNSEGSS